MGVSLQKVAGLSVVLKVALSNKNSGKFGQNSGNQSISICWSAAAADAAGIRLTEGSSHGGTMYWAPVEVFFAAAKHLLNE